MKQAISIIAFSCILFFIITFDTLSQKGHPIIDNKNYQDFLSRFKQSEKIFSKKPKILSDLDETIFNLSHLNWVDGFDSLYKIMRHRYPFSEWKKINWDKKYLETKPQIEQAYLSSDTASFTAAMLAYVNSIPDGHVSLTGNLSAYKRERFDGSFGLSMIPLSDGRIVVNKVYENTASDEMNIKCGDEIILWNGTPINEIPELELYNFNESFPTNYATREGRIISRYQVLSRAKIGEKAEVNYVSGEDGNTYTEVLTAYDDEGNNRFMSYFLSAPIPDFSDVVVYDTLDPDIGYLKILWESAEGWTLEEIRQSETYQEVRAAIEWFDELGIDKLIFDLRFNLGGHDLLGSAIAGFFLEKPDFYEHITSAVDNEFEIYHTIITQPEIPHFGGDVVVMTGPNNISTGEGIPMMLQRLPNVHVISFWGTNGSFGIVGDKIILTDSLLSVSFPFSRSLNENEVIQLDSDSELNGGVQPDISIPLTVKRVIDIWENEIDVELEYAMNFLRTNSVDRNYERIKIYPNPASYSIEINTNSILNNHSILAENLSIFNTFGERLLEIDLIQPDFNNRIMIDISDLPVGMYFIRIGDQTDKLLIVR